MEGEFAKVTAMLTAMFAAWRAEIDSVPFAYTDAELLAEHWRRTESDASSF